MQIWVWHLFPAEPDASPPPAPPHIYFRASWPSYGTGPADHAKLRGAGQEEEDAKRPNHLFGVFRIEIQEAASLPESKLQTGSTGL